MKLPLQTISAVFHSPAGCSALSLVLRRKRPSASSSKEEPVGGLPGPAPLQVELVVGERLVGDHIAERLAGDGDDAVLHAEDVLGGGGAVGLDVEGPSSQVLAVEQFRFAFPAGEEAKDAQDQEGGQVPFHGMIELVILTKVRNFLLNSQLAGYFRPGGEGLQRNQPV